jgi:hypothetical protein
MTARKSYEQELRERSERQEHLNRIVGAAMNRVLAVIVARQPAVSSHCFYGASAIRGISSPGIYSAPPQSARQPSKAD